MELMLFYDEEAVKASFDLALVGFESYEITNIIFFGRSICETIAKKILDVLDCKEIKKNKDKEHLLSIDLEKILMEREQIDKEIIEPLLKCKERIEKSKTYKDIESTYHHHYVWAKEKIEKVVDIIKQTEELCKKYDGKFPKDTYTFLDEQMKYKELTREEIFGGIDIVQFNPRLEKVTKYDLNKLKRL